VKFLADQDVWAQTLQTLRDWGHDVVAASDIGQARARDVDLLREAHDRGHILVTRDRDFGRLVFAAEQAAGILFLRITPATQDAVHEELARVLETHSQSELK
jgi:predicted nuclease of predicted toxin-antitoxin system